MIWFFTRGSAQVDIEVRRGGDPAVFELVIDYPDGSEHVRRFTEARKLVRRALQVQQRLIRDGWTPCNPDMRRTIPARTAAPRSRISRAPRRLWSRFQRHVRSRLAATFGL